MKATSREAGVRFPVPVRCGRDRSPAVGGLDGGPPRFSRAFTLIEIMVVVGIMGVLLAIGVPSIFRAMKKEGMRKAVSDMVDLCSNARARAVIGGRTTTLVFHPRERRCEISGGAGNDPGHAGNGETSTRFSEDVSIKMLDINLLEYGEAEEAQVRFFPNGTSDEMTLILQSADNQWRAISLEITTGLARVESDPQKFGQ